MDDIPGVTDLVEIGRGGFSRVYRAQQPALGRTVAVKVLDAPLTAESTPRFEREALVLGRLSDHDGILTIYASGVTEAGHGFLVLEHCAGGSLADRVRQDGVLAWSDAVGVSIDMADALAHAHAHGVLHRDVKPQNILVRGNGRLVLADFGIARMADGWNTTTGMVTASVAHAAPEVLNGAEPSAASDVWSLASTAYHLVLGRPPFSSTTDTSLAPMLARTILEPPPDLRGSGVPEQVATVLEQALTKDPVLRVPTAADLRDLLRAASRGAHAPDGATAADPASEELTIARRVVQPEEEVRAQPRRRRRAIPIGVVVGLLLIAGVLVRTLTTDGGERGRADSTSTSSTTTAESAPTSVTTAATVVEVAGATVTTTPTTAASTRRTVPFGLVGASYATAAAALGDRQLVPKRVDEPNDEFDAGRVFAVSPVVGATVERGATVTLRVSSGPSLSKVPDVTGQSPASAINALEAQGFTVGDLFGPASGTAVISTDPPAGASVRRGATVNIFVR